MLIVQIECLSPSFVRDSNPLIETLVSTERFDPILRPRFALSARGIGPALSWLTGDVCSK